MPAEDTEITVRFKLPVQGAAYNFGAKFGATADKAVELLQQVAEAGFIPSLTFHPGTQCTDPMAWDAYIRKAAWIAAEAGVTIARLNVGGGFPSHRLADVAPQLDEIFALIDRVADEAFGADRPALVCEPGRGLVAESYSFAVRVKAIRDGEHVFMNDGIYGGLAELPLIGVIDRIEVLSPDMAPRLGARGAADLLRPDLRFGRPAAGRDDAAGRHGRGRLHAVPRPRRLFDGDRDPVQRLRQYRHRNRLRVQGLTPGAGACPAVPRPDSFGAAAIRPRPRAASWGQVP